MTRLENGSFVESSAWLHCNYATNVGRGIGFGVGGRVVISAFRRAFDFRGRSSRQDIWFFSVGWFGCWFLLAIGNTYALRVIDRQFINYVFFGAAMLLIAASILPFAALVVRRVHDLGRSGWWGLVVLAPILSMSLWVLPGQSQPNRFGAPPRSDAPEPKALA